MGVAGRLSPATLMWPDSPCFIFDPEAQRAWLSLSFLRLQYAWSLIVPKFEDCLQQLEKIVEQLEKGDLPLEKSLQLFEEGVRLSNSCRQELEAAEGKVEILMKQGGKLQAEPFEAGKQAAGDGQ